MEDAMRTTVPMTVLATALACSFATAPAHARARVFVASYGSDSNPCTFLSPCRNFQQAVNVVDAGGEVTAIDSAGFGTIEITKAVTITSPAGVEAGIAAPPANGTAISINAGQNDAVVLSGLTLAGDNAAESFGIAFFSGLQLEIINCAIRGFTEGVYVSPSAQMQVLISNTVINDNVDGVALQTLGSGSSIIAAIDHVTLNNNHQGVYVFSKTSPIEASIRDSGIDNSGYGVNVTGTCPSNIATVVLRNVSLNENPNPILVQSCVNVYLSHVVQALAPPQGPNPGVIFFDHNNVHVFSDGTNLTSAPPNSFEVWGAQ
jgi:hypothetical protein